MSSMALPGLGAGLVGIAAARPGLPKSPSFHKLRPRYNTKKLKGRLKGRKRGSAAGAAGGAAGTAADV